MGINHGDAAFKLFQSVVAAVIALATIGYYQGVVPYEVAWTALTIALLWVTFPVGVFVAAFMRELNKSIKRRYRNA